MAVDAALRQKILDLGLQNWLDAWERAGLDIPQGSRSLKAFTDTLAAGDRFALHPDGFDRLIAGLQNSIVEVMARSVEGAWVDAIQQRDTLSAQEDVAWVPAGKASMNGMGVRLFKKGAAVRERWMFKEHILVQIPTADQGTYGTFSNRVDWRWTCDDAVETGIPNWKARIIRIGSDRVTTETFNAEVSADPTLSPDPLTYSADKKVYEARAVIGTYDVGDIVIAQIDRDDDINDTLNADVGLIESRIV